MIADVRASNRHPPTIYILGTKISHSGTKYNHSGTLMPMKKKTIVPAKSAPRTAFNYRPDETRSQQLADLVRKMGVRQQGIVSIAISKLWESECNAART